MNRNPKHKYIDAKQSLILSLLLVLCATCSAQTAELVWVESVAQGSQIMHSQLIEKKWQTPKAIHSSTMYLVTPTISRSPDGSALLVWSEIDGSSSHLKYSRKNKSANIWQQAKEIQSDGVENLAATAITDTDGQVWLFWSSNNGDDDDIFYAQTTESGWSKPIQLHTDNDVPDILPLAELNSNGDIVVNWQTLNTQLLQYENVSFTIEKKNNSRSRTDIDSDIDNDNDLTVTDISLPNFLPTGPAILYFPENASTQSFRIN